MKKKIIFISIMLSFVFAFISIFNGVPMVYEEAKIRTITTENIDTLSINEKAKEELNKFDEFILQQDENDSNIITFNGTRTFKLKDYASLDLVSTFDSDEDVTVNYDLECDKTTTELNATITYAQDDNIIDTQNLHIVKIEHVEENDDALLYMENGSCISANSLFEEESINDCAIGESAIALSLIEGIEICGATAAVVSVVVYVVIVVVIAVIIYYVFRLLFWWCSRSSVSYRYEQRTVPSITTYLAPAITINAVRHETKAMTKEEILSLPRTDSQGNAIYYLAFASGVPTKGDYKDTSLSDGGLFISPIKLTYKQALAIMANKNYTKVGDEKEFAYVPSIYAYSDNDIFLVMDQCGYAEDTPKYYPERHESGLWHYHSATILAIPYKGKGTKDYRPHAFFSIALASSWINFQ